MNKKSKPWWIDPNLLSISTTDWSPIHKVSPTGNRGWRNCTYIVQARTDRIAWYFLGRYKSVQAASDCIRANKRKGSPYYYRIVQEWTHEDETLAERHYIKYILLEEPRKEEPPARKKRKVRLNPHVWDVMWRRIGGEWKLFQTFRKKRFAESALDALRVQWDGFPYEVKIEYRREKRSGKGKERGSESGSTQQPE